MSLVPVQRREQSASVGSANKQTKGISLGPHPTLADVSPPSNFVYREKVSGRQGVEHMPRSEAAWLRVPALPPASWVTCNKFLIFPTCKMETRTASASQRTIPHPVAVNGCCVTSHPTTHRLKPQGCVISGSGAEAGLKGSFSRPTGISWWPGCAGRAAPIGLTWPGSPTGQWLRGRGPSSRGGCSTAPPPRASTPKTKVEARCPKLPRVTPAPFSWSKQPCEGKGEQTPAPDGGAAGNPQ